MAGIDHPVHARTREAAGAKWGCHNRPAFAAGYWAPDRRYSPDGLFETALVWVPRVMSTECRNDISMTDPKCDGCRHRGTGEAYSAFVRANGT